MQAVFERFKAFVNDQIPYHYVNMILSPMTVDTFMAVIVKMRAADPYRADIAGDVLARLNIDPADFKPEAMDKFVRYCDYFDATARSLLADS